MKDKSKVRSCPNCHNSLSEKGKLLLCNNCKCLYRTVLNPNGERWLFVGLILISTVIYAFTEVLIYLKSNEIVYDKFYSLLKYCIFFLLGGFASLYCAFYKNKDSLKHVKRNKK